MSQNLEESFYSLTPNEVLDAVDECGFVTTGHYIQLNSYENRVFDIHLEKDLNPPELKNHLIAKFYRPHRWSKDCILEEHEFLFDLKQQDIPVIAPLLLEHKGSISEHNKIFTTFFPKGLGRMPQELNAKDFKKIGRTLARIHNTGEQKKAQYRPTLNTDTYGWPSLDVLDSWVAPEVHHRYFQAAETILTVLDEKLDENQFLRIHGDCHKGNLLLTDNPGQENEFFFVDFDDFCMGPVAQDFWMLFSGHEESQHEAEGILSGYEELRHFDDSQFQLFEPLRGLRIIHYAAWIARRWQDPSFPQIFPQFKNYNYWAEETEALEKIASTL